MGRLAQSRSVTERTPDITETRAARLAAILPGDPNLVGFATSGSEAVGSAVTIAP
jgi:4-aminobutyrate aminotransferase-like enzyme